MFFGLKIDFYLKKSYNNSVMDILFIRSRVIFLGGGYMKSIGKILSVIFVLLILSVSILSISGYSYYHGDNEITVVKGAQDLALASDMGRSIKVNLVPSSKDEVDKAFDIIEKRIAYIGLTDYRLYIQDSTGNIEFILPEDVVHDYDANELITFLAAPGYVTMRPGAEFGDEDSSTSNLLVDSSGGAAMYIPVGETAQTIILDSYYIKSGSYYDYKEDGETYYFVDLEFNDEGAAVLSQVTDPNLVSGTTPSYYESVVSIWIDDRMIAYPTVTEHFGSGYMSFTHADFTPQKAKLYAAIIDCGMLPCYFTYESEFVEVEAINGDNSAAVVKLVSACAVLVLAFVLIYLFRANGVITLISVMLQFAVLFSYMTGFFGDAESFVVGIPAIAAAALSVMLTVTSCVIISSQIKNEIKHGSVLTPAINNGFKNSRAIIFDISAVLAVISVLGMLMFGGSGIGRMFGNALSGGLYRFSNILFIGSVVNFVAGYLLPRFFVSNLMDIKFFSKPSMFGGKEK